MKRKSNKTNTFRIRTTEADGQDIRMKADALGCSVSEYIRRCCTSSRDIYFILRIHKCYFDPRTMSHIEFNYFLKSFTKAKKSTYKGD